MPNVDGSVNEGSPLLVDGVNKIDPPLPPHSNSVACLTALKRVLTFLSWNILDFIRIYVLFQTLGARYVLQLFNELKMYGEAPSLKDQESWVAGVSLFASTFLAVSITKIANAISERKYQRYFPVQDYFAALFLSTIVFFIGDLLSPTGRMAAMSKPAFAATSLIGVFICMAFFLKIATPHSSNRSLFSHDEGEPKNRFHTLSICFSKDEVTRFERVLNGMSGLTYAAALSIFFWVLNREVRGASVPLTLWQQIILGVIALSSAIFTAWSKTNFPKLFLGLIMLSIAMNYGAMAYSTFSGIAYEIVKYTNADGEFHVSEKMNLVLTLLGALLSFVIAIFSGLMVDFPFQLSHEQSKKLERRVKNIPSTVKAGIFSVVAEIRKRCSTDIIDVKLVSFGMA